MRRINTATALCQAACRKRVGHGRPGLELQRHQPNAVGRGEANRNRERRAGCAIEIVAVSARDRTRDRGVDLARFDWVDDAAELAARRRTGDALAQMGHALEEMGKHGLATQEGQRADQTFHTVLLKATRNASLISLASSIEAAVRWTTIYKQRKRKLPRDPLPDHRTLVEALCARAPARDAREARPQLRSVA